MAQQKTKFYFALSFQLPAIFLSSIFTYKLSNPLCGPEQLISHPSLYIPLSKTELLSYR